MSRIQASFTEKVFAFAMVCSVWTQIRVASVIGLSEVLLLFLGVYGVYYVSNEIINYYFYQNEYIKVVAAIIPLGMLWNFLTQNNFFSMLHDLFAFIFVIYLVYRVLNRLKIYENILGILYYFFIFETFVNIMYLGMYAVGMGMYYEERFTGWSSDPNQLAEVLFLIPWLSIYFLRKIREQNPINSFWCNVTCAFCFGSSLVIGLLTESDSYILSSVVALVVYLVGETWKILTTGQGNKLVILINIVIIGYLLMNFSIVRETINSYIVETAADSNQLVGRQKVWLHGFQAFLNSPMIGNGPGAYSGNWFAFGNMESHNTYIYIMMDFGIIGLLMLLRMFYAAWRQIRYARSMEMLAALVGFLVFNWFHSFHRMPLFWFYIYLFISVGIAESITDEI